MTWTVGVCGTVLGHGATKEAALDAASPWSSRQEPLESAVLLEATERFARLLASPSCPPHPSFRVRDGKADVP